MRLPVAANSDTGVHNAWRHASLAFAARLWCGRGPSSCLAYLCRPRQKHGLWGIAEGMLLPRTFLIREELGLGRSSASLLRIAAPAYDAAFMPPKTSPRPSSLREKAQLMSASEIERTLVRLVHEIIEK